MLTFYVLARVAARQTRPTPRDEGRDEVDAGAGGRGAQYEAPMEAVIADALAAAPEKFQNGNRND